MPPAEACVAAIDFGTSNSAVCLAAGGRTFLVPLEHGRETIPTAVFYNAEQQATVFGRQALQQYEEGTEGRLMRSLKSLLGSDLLSETTLVNGRNVAYRHVIAEFLAHLKNMAESHASCRLERLVMGRPVHFVDDDPERDRLAEATLAEIACDAGFEEVSFEYEPIAAAFDFETSLETEEVVLVVDIGGGTSDFSLVRLGPSRRTRGIRTGDLLASSGIHLAGGDFDQRLSLATVMGELGYESPGKDGKLVPSALFFELATWHKINFLYTFRELALAEDLKYFMEDARLHERLMTVLKGRHGHRIASHVEGAKIAVAEGGDAAIDLAFIEEGLRAAVSEADLTGAIRPLLQGIVRSALTAVRQAGMAPAQVTALYFTGGSVAIRELRRAFHEAFPESRVVIGDHFASVARGLGLSALR
jgi:hypothetical chaperone protein